MVEYRAVLEEIGLTKSEIAAYVALLELGSTSVGKIIDYSKTTPSKIYKVLERLMQKGLVSYVMQNGVKVFTAASPNRLYDVIAEKRRHLDKMEKGLDDVVPVLALKEKQVKLASHSTVYEGIKGLQTAFGDALDALREGEESLAMNIPKRYDAVNAYFVRFGKMCERKNVKQKYIFNLEAKGQGLTAVKQKGLEIKYSPSSTPASISVIGNTVIIYPTDGKQIRAFVINDSNTANSFRKQFFEVWESAV